MRRLLEYYSSLPPALTYWSEQGEEREANFARLEGIVSRHKQISENAKNELYRINDKPLRFFLANTNEDYPLIAIDQTNNIVLVKEFFYFTLVGEAQYLFHLYLSLLIRRDELGDLLIDVYPKMQDFLTFRKNSIDHQSSEVLLYKEKLEDHHFALCAINFLKKRPMNVLNLLEKKFLRDLVGNKEMKKLLGLKEDDYNYLENPNPKPNEEELENFSRLKKEFDASKINFEEYVQNHLKGKKIISWIWWTISPYVSADVSRLLPILYEYHSIERIYLDLPKNNQEMINQYIEGDSISEEELEETIKKVYPPQISDYQKETLPYLVLLNKLKELKIPVTCFGKDGGELMTVSPVMDLNQKIFYPLDDDWKNAFLYEYGRAQQKEDDKLVIFFSFLKPMYFLPPEFRNDLLETIIHADKFTGFGPRKPENSLSYYSRYLSFNEKSFIMPDVHKSSIKNELVVYFPYKEIDNGPTLEDSHFNRFRHYRTMIYSNHSGGGGGNQQNVDTPQGEYSFTPS